MNSLHNLNREIILGPGHSLNELIARLFWISETNGDYSHTEWELYPGVFGLYARHNDDYVATTGHRTLDHSVLDHYNNVVRCATTPEPINNFNKNHFYVNCTFDVMKNIYKDITAPVYCAKLDMENYPETRYHFAMMEYSEGAAEHLNYGKKPTLLHVAKRCFIKNCTENEQDMDINWINVGKVLQKDYSDFPDHCTPHIENFNAIIDQYNWYNRISDFTMQQLVDMSWDEILDIT